MSPYMQAASNQYSGYTLSQFNQFTGYQMPVHVERHFGSPVGQPIPQGFSPQINGPVMGSDYTSTDQNYCEATRQGKRKNFKNAEERHQFKSQYEIKKKTELCRNFEIYGKCKFGDSCSYAHGRDELQKKTHVPTNFKTKLCT